MNGSGCKTCPVNPCHTLYYRGSYCAEQRAKLGLGDPLTNADRIRAMTDEELIAFFVLEDKCPPKRYASRYCDNCDSCKDCWIDWLKQPAEVSHD